jgi:sec-independent protein translocase protein TatB
MFDIGWSELFIIGVIALIVIGPKDMPAAMRAVARIVSRLRGLSREFQSGMADMMREAELDDLKRKMDQAGRVDPAHFVKDHVDPSGSLTADFDPRQFNRAVMEGSLTTSPAPGRTEGVSPAPAGNNVIAETSGETTSEETSLGSGEPPKPASQ